MRVDYQDRMKAAFAYVDKQQGKKPEGGQAVTAVRLLRCRHVFDPTLLKQLHCLRDFCLTFSRLRAKLPGEAEQEGSSTTGAVVEVVKPSSKPLPREHRPGPSSQQQWSGTLEKQGVRCIGMEE